MQRNFEVCGETTDGVVFRTGGWHTLFIVPRCLEAGSSVLGLQLVLQFGCRIPALSKTSRERRRERNGTARQLFPVLPHWVNFCRASYRTASIGLRLAGRVPRGLLFESIGESQQRS
jgi:hypothetical protein